MNLDRLRSPRLSLPTDRSTRMLLPFIGLLIIALVAIPTLLSHSGRAAAVAPLPPTPRVALPDPGALVADAPPASSSHQGPVTGRPHDPFAKPTSTATTAGSTPAPAPSASTGATGGTAATATLAPPAPTSSPSAGTGSATPPASRAGAPAAVTRTVTVTVPSRTRPGTTKSSTHPRHKVSQHPAASTTDASAGALAAARRYSDSRVTLALSQPGSSAPTRILHGLSRDELLPSDRNPLLTFLGVRTDGHTAVFVLPAGTRVQGQGKCVPSIARCTYLLLTPHQHVAITPAGAASASVIMVYRSLHVVTASGNIVTVDHAGAAALRQSSGYPQAVSRVTYTSRSGLLRIHLGSSPVNL